MSYQNIEPGSISKSNLLDRLHESNINGLLDEVILELQDPDTVESIAPVQLVLLLFVLLYEYPFLLTSLNQSPLTTIFEDACNALVITDLNVVLNQPNNLLVKELIDFFAINCEKLPQVFQHDSNVKKF